MARPAIVPDLLSLRAALSPGAIALVVDPLDVEVGPGNASAQHLTFGDWDRRSNAAARGLAERGVGAGDRVALLFDNMRWFELAVGWMAVLKAGGVAVVVAPRFPRMELDRTLRACRASLVVSPGDLLPGEGPVGVADLEADRSTGPVPSVVGPDDPASVLYVEGAMRTPAGLVSTHAELLGSSPVAGPGRLLHAFAPGTAAGRDALLLPLRSEQSVALVAPAFDPDRFCAAAAEAAAGIWGLTTAMARALLKSGALTRHDVPSVRRLVLAGPPRWTEVVAGLSRALPGVDVVTPPVLTPGLPALRVPTPAPSSDGRERAPLATSQDGMVWHEQFTPGSFNLSPPVRRYRGPLDLGALESALDEIVRRHPALRTRFTIEDGEAEQVFPPHGPLALRVVDLSDVAAPDLEAALGGLVSDARRRPFDLVEGPLFEPILVRIGPEDHAMVLRTHHAVYDDWSVGIFRRELSALYNAYVAGRPSPLPPVALHLPDLLRRRQMAREGEAGAEERAYWKRELAGAPLSVQLPIDDPGRPEGSPHTAPPPISFDIPPDLTRALSGIGRDNRATVFMVLLAAFGVLVQRFTGQDDVLVSTLAANRAEPGSEDLIGCFGKKVLVRLRLHDDPPFPELILRTRRSLMGALAHQNLAYEAVLQEVLGSDAADHGLSPQVAIKFQAAITPRDKLELTGLETGALELAPPGGDSAHFLAGEGRGEPDDGPAWGAGMYLGAFLGLSVVETGDSLRLVTEGVFHPPEVERLLSHLRVLLTDIVADPTRPVSELHLVASTGSSGPTGGGMDGDRGDAPTPGKDQFKSPAGTVDQAFADEARRSPRRAAVVTDDRRLTFAELDEWAEGVAHGLQGAGVGTGGRSSIGRACGPETPVGLNGRAGPELVAGVLGIWKAGGAVLPVDRDEGSERTARVLADAGATIVVGDDVGADAPRPAARGGAHSVPERPPRDGINLAWVHRGPWDHRVDIEHGSLMAVGDGLRSLAAEAAPLRVATPAVPAAPAFLRGLLALARGNTLRLVALPPEADPTTYVTLVENGEVDVVDCSPEGLGALLDAGLQRALDGRPATAPVPILLVAADRSLSPEEWRAWRRISGARAHFLYAPPECSFGATTCPASGSSPRPSIGRPLVGVGAEVIDRRGRDSPLRAPGRLHVQGPNVARGYRDQADLTADRFGPGGEGGRVFRTGRQARRMPDGTIQLHRNPDELVDLRGFLVEPARIMAALNGCPGVARVAVTHEGDERGDGPRLVASVVPRAGEPTPTLEQLRLWLWKRLPGYAWPMALSLGTGGPAVVPAAMVGLDLPDPRVPLLAEAWAEVLATENPGAGANYWQSFSFLDALAEARACGSPVENRHVLRNRTIETLATDVAASASPGRDDHRK